MKENTLPTHEVSVILTDFIGSQEHQHIAKPDLL